MFPFKFAGDVIGQITRKQVVHGGSWEQKVRNLICSLHEQQDTVAGTHWVHSSGYAGSVHTCQGKAGMFYAM